MAKTSGARVEHNSSSVQPGWILFHERLNNHPEAESESALQLFTAEELAMVMYMLDKKPYTIGDFLEHITSLQHEILRLSGASTLKEALEQALSHPRAPEPINCGVIRKKKGRNYPLI